MSSLVSAGAGEESRAGLKYESKSNCDLALEFVDLSIRRTCILDGGVLPKEWRHALICLWEKLSTQ